MLAVVVSYNGGSTIRACVEAVSPQVGHVLIVDNGSEPNTLAILDGLERRRAVSVRRLSVNHGIGYALNLGIAEAISRGFSWLITLDQDSVPDPGMIRAYEAAIERHPNFQCLVPRLEDGPRGAEPERVVSSAITSGNLVRLDVFDRIGRYDDKLFIDSVDFDFSLRLRRAGLLIHQISSAEMRHSVGDPTKVPRSLRRYYAQHAPVRRYYMTRNFLYLAERHARAFPGFIVKLGMAHVINCVFIALFDPSPLRSYGAMIHGVRDYLRRRTGVYEARP